MKLLIAVVALVAVRQIAKRVRRPRTEIGGSMVVDEVDEVELSAGNGREGYDPDQFRSAHPEINDLRSNMP